MNVRVAIVTALGVLAAACAPHEADPLIGYVEGTFVHIAAETPGRLTERPVRAGARIDKGELVFALDRVDQREAYAAAEARLMQARAELANLTTGQRDEEIAVIAAELESARTRFSQADDEFARKLSLRDRGVTPVAMVDAARAERDAAAATVDATEQRLRVAGLPARPDVIEAARLAVAANEADLARAHHALDLRSVNAPVAAKVETTFFEVGELVPAGATVATLLPDDARKVRFFLPETDLAGVDVGDTVSLACDGCADGLTAEVTFIATEAEFTPPVIFSQEARDKLVFLVEASPIGDAQRLKVGQPVDVTLPDGVGS